MFSKAATSALYLVGYYASQGRGVLVTAEEVAQVYGLSSHSVARVALGLAKARILMSHRGRGGGFSLEKDPKEISLLEVIEAVDGPILPYECMLKRGACDAQPSCGVFSAIHKATKKMRDVLESISIASIACPLPPDLAHASLRSRRL